MHKIWVAAEQGIKLNESQRTAVEKLLTSEDRIIGLQGGAGTGKTTVLATLREAAEGAGYQVQGFAPTTRAAALLAESGMQTKTLQRYLREPQVASDKGRRMRFTREFDDAEIDPMPLPNQPTS